MQNIHYKIIPKSTGAHIFRVTINIKNNQKLLIARLPKWIPGSYKIRDFSKHISNITASAKNKSKLQINRISSCSWEIVANGDDVVIKYDVYAYDLSVRGAYLDNHRLFFNHCCVFLDIIQYSNSPRTIDIQTFDNWKIFTELPQKEKYFYADNYFAQIDCPVESAKELLEVSETVESIPHKMLFTGTLSDSYDIKKMAKLVAKICLAQIKLFGSSPIERDYLFMTYIEKNQYGGLEHKNSTALMASPEMMLKKGEKLTEKNINFLALCSHEYFHLWNIKRLRPADLIPYNLYSEQHTEMLWMFEGFTSYYDEMMLLRAKVIDGQHFLNRQAENITRVLKIPGRKLQSIADSSFHAWTKLYQVNENSANTIVSYYSKGAMFALFLDLWIRKNSENKKSLDNVMQGLWLTYGKDKELIGINEAIVFKFCIDLVPKTKHKELMDLFKTGIHGTDDLDFIELFTEFGIKYKTKTETVNNKKQTTTAGIVIKKSNSNKIIIAFLDSNSYAAKQGISVNDEIIAINNQSAESIDVNVVLNLGVPKAKVKITINRRGMVFTKKIKLVKANKNKVILKNIKENSLQKDWLKSWI